MNQTNPTLTRRAALASAISLLLLPSCAAKATAPENKASQESITLLVGATESSRRIAWRSDSTDIALVQWTKNSLPDGIDPFLLGCREAPVSYVDVSQPSRHGYVAEMEDLEPNTEYVYRVCNGDTTSETFSFKTLEKGYYSFVFAGDPQIGAGSDDREIWKAVTDRALSADGPLHIENPAFLVTAGDNIDSSCFTESNDPIYYDWYDALNVPAFHLIPLAPSIGNHEALHTLFKEYYPLLATQNGTGTTQAGGNWWFTFNETLFAMINGSCEDTTAHASFIKDAVAKNPSARWRIAVIHHNLFSVFPWRNTDDTLESKLKKDLAPLFTEKGFDLILSGHDHLYQRSFVMKGTAVAEKQGLEKGEVTTIENAMGPVYVSGNGSASKFYEASTPIAQPANAKTIQTQTPHFSRVDVAWNRLAITTFDMTSGKTIDSVILLKNE